MSATLRKCCGFDKSAHKVHDCILLPPPQCNRVMHRWKAATRATHHEACQVVRQGAGSKLTLSSLADRASFGKTSGRSETRPRSMPLATASCIVIAAAANPLLARARILRYRFARVR